MWFFFGVGWFLRRICVPVRMQHVLVVIATRTHLLRVDLWFDWCYVSSAWLEPPRRDGFLWALRSLLYLYSLVGRFLFFPVCRSSFFILVGSFTF